MDIIYVIMLVFMTGSFCIISFLIGSNNKKQSINPIQNIKEKKEIKKKKIEADLKSRQTKTMLGNVDRYDGTSLGQQDIPLE